MPLHHAIFPLFFFCCKLMRAGTHDSSKKFPFPSLHTHPSSPPLPSFNPNIPSPPPARPSPPRPTYEDDVVQGLAGVIILPFLWLKKIILLHEISPLPRLQSPKTPPPLSSASGATNSWRRRSLWSHARRAPSG
jgi:hypothetical protein